MEVNGVKVNFPGELTVAEFMEKEGYGAKKAVVEINEEVVPRSQWESRKITDQDKIEIVTFVGGG